MYSQSVNVDLLEAATQPKDKTGCLMFSTKLIQVLQKCVLVSGRRFQDSARRRRQPSLRAAGRRGNQGARRAVGRAGAGFRGFPNSCFIHSRTPEADTCQACYSGCVRWLRTLGAYAGCVRWVRNATSGCAILPLSNLRDGGSNQKLAGWGLQGTPIPQVWDPRPQVSPLVALLFPLSSHCTDTSPVLVRLRRRCSMLASPLWPSPSSLSFLPRCSALSEHRPHPLSGRRVQG